MILTVAELRLLVTSSLEEPALQILLDAEEAAIIAAVGGTGEVTEHIQTNGYHRLVLGRPAGTIASLTEYIGGVATVLSTNDYRADGYVLARLGRGTNPSWRWAPHVMVVYTPTADMADWKRVQLLLIKLDLDYQPGVTAETIGTWSTQTSNNSVWHYDLERATILASLSGSGRMVITGDDEWMTA